MSFESFGALICNHAFQIAVLSAIVLGLVKLLGNDRPHLAHALWALVVLKCLTPPIIASPLSPFSWFPTQHRTASSTVAPTKDSGIPVVVAPQPTVHITYHDPLPIAAPVALKKEPTPKTTLASSAWLAFFSIWLGGIGVVFATLCWRVTAYAQLVHRRTIPTPDDLEQLVNRLTSQLSLRRDVRVRVVDGPIGPAVAGVLRPKLLLPQCIVDSQPRASLQTLIAHELTHVRRGDLWWSAIQTAASLCWWFHPCVWLASRQLTRETERSCDEETIVSLNLRPADYARTLLDVLESKSEIVAAPIVPGVRPVDITKKRMERIMRIGQGSHPRTPCWVIPLLLAGATLALPGTRWLDAQEEGKNKQVATSPQSEPPGQRLPYAKELRTDALIAPAQPAPSNWPPLAKDTAGDDQDILAFTVLILDIPTKLLEELVDRSRVDLSGAVSSDLGIAGKLITGEIPEGYSETSAVVSATATTPISGVQRSKAFPMLLGEKQRAIVKQWVIDTQTSGASILSRPRLATRSGQQASFRIGQEHPFVVSLAEDEQPVVRVVEAGIKGELTATIEGSGQSPQVTMQCKLTQIEIASVLETKTTNSDGTVTTLQKPTTQTQSTEFTFKAPIGATFAALLGPKKSESGSRTTLCIITQDKLQQPAKSEATHKSPVDAAENNENVSTSDSETTQRIAEVTQQLKTSRSINPTIEVVGPTIVDPFKASPLSDTEILVALRKHLGDAAPSYTTTSQGVQIVKEKIKDYCDAPRFIPLLGPCKQWNQLYKCSIYSDHEGKKGVDVAYIKHIHWIMVGSLEKPSATASVSESHETTKEQFDVLDQAKESSVPTVRADILVLELPAKLLAEIKLQSNATVGSLVSHQATPRKPVTTNILEPTNSPPPAIVLLSDEDHQRILEWTQPTNRSGVKVIARPSLAMRSGVPATLVAGGQAPVLNGYDRAAGKPQFSHHAIGLQADITTTLSSDAKTIALDCHLSHSTLVEQGEGEKRRAITIEVSGKRFQQPCIKTHSASFAMNLPLRTAVASIAGRQRRAGVEYATVFVVSVSPTDRTGIQ